jgi:3-oxoacyl-[acyl-carrier-protein] synthase II
MSGRRVVITGLGVVAPNGIGPDAFWQSLLAGRSAVDFIRSFDPTGYPSKVAAEILDFRPEEFMHPRRVAHRGRFSQLAVAAAKLAVRDARLSIPDESPERVMACVGTSMNGIGDVYEKAHAGFERSGLHAMPPLSALEYAAHAPVSHISTELGLRGQAATVGSACATGLDALEWGYTRISDGTADVVLAGATDAPLAPFAFAALCALGVLSQHSSPPEKASRPYDLHRDGLVVGEGAAVCVLEDLDHALRRSAPVYAELLGFGAGNEAGYGPKVDAAEHALASAVGSALARAHLAPSAIDYICAHGNALPDYDLVETRAFKRVFGSWAYHIPVSSIKSMIGHAMGAASALQVAAACLALRAQAIPPTINLDTPDPECDLDYVPRRARSARLRHVLVNAHAMGGTHAVLILGHPRLR